MIPPSPATDDLSGASIVVDTDVLIDLFSCHSIVEAWNHGAAVDPTVLGKRCTRARDALLVASALHNNKTRTYSLRAQWLNVLEQRVPPSVNDIPAFFARVVHLYILPTLLPDWRTVFPDDGGAPEPVRTAADRELERVAREYRLPLMTLDGDLTKRARKSGVTVITPAEYVASTSVDRVQELDAFFERYLDGVSAFANTQPNPAGVAERMRWLHDVIFAGIRARAT